MAQAGDTVLEETRHLAGAAKWHIDCFYFQLLLRSHRKLLIDGTRRASHGELVSSEMNMSVEGRVVESIPIDSGHLTSSTISRVVSIKALRPEQHVTRDHAGDDLGVNMIGESEVLQALKRSIRTVATSAETVLITGESGTGKELVARAVHELSSRRNHPFLAVNCASLTESLLESELFGHVRGSFTGATANKRGFFEAAGNGTIFLDEFAEMSLAMQAKLLRVLQERKVRPVGLTNTREISIDARVLVATNHDLKRDIAARRFRSDLYYRVNVLELHASPLRDRPQDILRLAQHFIRNYNEQNNCKVPEQFDSEVLRLLEAYSWPGNVRELENIIKRLALAQVGKGTGNQITASDLQHSRELTQPVQATLQLNESDQSRSTRLERVAAVSGQVQCRCQRELGLYHRRLNEAGGNLTEAARKLSLHRNTLRKRLMRLRQNCCLEASSRTIKPNPAEVFE